MLSTRTLAGGAPLPAVGVGTASQGWNPASGPLKFTQGSRLILGFIFGDECRAHGLNLPVLPYLSSRQCPQGLPSTRDSSWLPICPARKLMFPPTCEVSPQRPRVSPFVAAPCGMRHFPGEGLNQAPCIESLESSPLNHWGSPFLLILKQGHYLCHPCFILPISRSSSPVK